MNKFIASAFLLVSCASDIYVVTDYDKEHDIKTYSDYQWAETKNIEGNHNPIYYNELNDKRIKAAVNKKLVEKGFHESIQGAELILHYHIVVSDMVAYRENTIFNHDATWLRPDFAYYKYNEGTLIIDIMDLSNCLVWRGCATQILDNLNPELSEVKINQSISKIFARFPKR